MWGQFLRSTMMVTVAVAAVGGIVSVSVMRTSAQAPVPMKTAWGEPDLQGIWTDETDTPLQRSPKFANQEFFTEAQREELDRERGEHFSGDPRQERGTAIDVGGAYNTAFLSIKRVGLRTSLIVDPPNGRIPPQTPEAQQAAAADREFRLALLQSTEVRARFRRRRAPEANTIRRPRLDSQNLRLATIPVTLHVSTAVMVRRTTGWQTAACTRDCPILEACSAEAIAESCRHLTASRCSTT